MAISSELATLFEKNLAIYIIMPGALFSLYKMQSLSGCFSIQTMRRQLRHLKIKSSSKANLSYFSTFFKRFLQKKRLLTQKQDYFCKAAIFFVLYCISLENCLQSKDFFFRGIKGPLLLISRSKLRKCFLLLKRNYTTLS